MSAFLSRCSFVCLLIATFGIGHGSVDSMVLAQEPAAEPDPLFPDPALAAVMRASVLAKRDNSEPLTREDVADISRVEAPRQKIHNLEGLQHCHSLMLVEFTDNVISDLTPLAELTKLQSVSLAGNHIADLSPLAKLTAIQLLDLSGNEVRNLDALRKMTNMRTLYLADNKLDCIAALAKLQKISGLDVAGNRIQDLGPVSGLKRLTTLEISDNSIKSLAPLTELADLSMLIMPNNPIDSLDPIVKMCVEDADANRRFAPYLKIYLNLQSDQASVWQNDIEKLKAVGLSVHDYRRPASPKSTRTP